MKNLASKRCPICKKEAPKENPSFPFCSERCKLIDLGKWASGDYRVPGEPVKKEKEDENGSGEKGSNQRSSDSKAE